MEKEEEEERKGKENLTGNVVKTRVKIVGEESEKENRMATKEKVRRKVNISRSGLYWGFLLLHSVRIHLPCL